MIKHPLESVLFVYLEEKDITKESYDLYLIILKQYITYLKEQEITYASTHDLKNYIERLRIKNYSTRWIYNQISAIKGFYQYLKRNGRRLDLPHEYAEDISEPIKNERITHHFRETLSLEQAKHLIVFLKENRRYIWHYRDYAIIYLMLISGMRSVEIRRAKKKDISVMNDKTLLYVQGKGRTSKDEYVVIPKGCHQAIMDYVDKRKDKNPYLFIAHSQSSKYPYLARTFFNAMFKRVLKDAGLNHLKITIHALRHTAATLNLKRGGTLDETRKFLRHQTLDTTLIYAHHLKRKTEDSEDQIEQFILGKKVETTPNSNQKKEEKS